MHIGIDIYLYHRESFSRHVLYLFIYAYEFENRIYRVSSCIPHPHASEMQLAETCCGVNDPDDGESAP